MLLTAIQCFLAADDAALGDLVSFGDVIKLVHRGTQKALAKKSTSGDAGVYKAILQQDQNE